MSAKYMGQYYMAMTDCSLSAPRTLPGLQSNDMTEGGLNWLRTKANEIGK